MASGPLPRLRRLPSPHHHLLPNLERHQILPDLQRPAIGLPRLGDEIVQRRRRDALARQKDVRAADELEIVRQRLTKK